MLVVNHVEPLPHVRISIITGNMISCILSKSTYHTHDLANKGAAGRVGRVYAIVTLGSCVVLCVMKYSSEVSRFAAHQLLSGSVKTFAFIKF